MISLAFTILVGLVSWCAWTGFDLGPMAKWDGLPSLLRGSWAWDFRYALIPVYAVLTLRIAEGLGALLHAKLVRKD
jgi:hypothetical protein